MRVPMPMVMHMGVSGWADEALHVAVGAVIVVGAIALIAAIFAFVNRDDHGSRPGNR